MLGTACRCIGGRGSRGVGVPNLVLMLGLFDDSFKGAALAELRDEDELPDELLDELPDELLDELPDELLDELVGFT